MKFKKAWRKEPCGHCQQPTRLRFLLESGAEFVACQDSHVAPQIPLIPGGYELDSGRQPRHLHTGAFFLSSDIGKERRTILKPSKESN